MTSSKFQDVASDLNPPIGKNVLQLTDIEESANYTCVAASKLGIIEKSTLVRVQGTFKLLYNPTPKGQPQYFVFLALPHPPSDVTVSEITPTSVRLSWSYPTHAGASDVQVGTFQKAIFIISVKI